MASDQLAESFFIAFFNKLAQINRVVCHADSR
jgi:hypothetical protein